MKKKPRHVPCCTCQDCQANVVTELQAELKVKDEKIKRLYKLLADYGYMGEYEED